MNETDATEQPAAERQGESRPRGRPFRPGESGNPGGRRRGAVSLRRAVERVLTRSDAEAVARRIIGMALRGSIKATRLLCELTGDIAVRGPVPSTQQGTMPSLDVTVDAAALRERVRATVDDVHRIDALIDRGLLLAVGGGNGGNGDGGGNGGA